MCLLFFGILVLTLCPINTTQKGCQTGNGIVQQTFGNVRPKPMNRNTTAVLPLRWYGRVGLVASVRIDGDDVESIVDTGSQYLTVFDHECTSCGGGFDAYDVNPVSDTLGGWKQQFAGQISHMKWFRGRLTLPPDTKATTVVRFGSVERVETRQHASAPFMGLIKHHQEADYRVSLLRQLPWVRSIVFDLVPGSPELRLSSRISPPNDAVKIDMLDTRGHRIGFYAVEAFDPETSIRYTAVIDTGTTGTATSGFSIPRTIRIGSITLRSHHEIVPNIPVVGASLPIVGQHPTLVLGLTWLWGREWHIIPDGPVLHVSESDVTETEEK